MKRILVTGASGFVGREVVSVLVQRGQQVIVTDKNCDGLEDIPGLRAVSGDIRYERVRRAAIDGADAIIHLATIPGGAAEQNPELARQVNVDAAMALSGEFSVAKPGAPFVLASSVAVLGHPLPARVDDATPVAPKMLYGTHKAMLEVWLAALHRRAALSAISLRLPGIVARPQVPSGLKSAFLSDIFHALAARRPIGLPVSASATTWLMSVRQVAECLADGLSIAGVQLPESRAITLPSLRVSISELVAEICRQCNADPSLVRYEPEEAIELAFGQLPPLITADAERLGFRNDGNISRLVRSALETL